MQTNRFAYNIVGLFIAGLCLFAALSTVFIVLPALPPEKRAFFHFLGATEAITSLTVGVGGIINLAKGRQLAPWPTGIMIFGYCVTVWLLPIAIWGMVSLFVENKYRRSKPHNLPPPLANP